MNHLILASTSAVRAKLLTGASIPFTACASAVDEVFIRAQMQSQSASPRDIALALARHKAQAVTNQYTDDIILGCDQLLEFDNKILAKPENIMQAREQLKALRGKSHSLLSAAVLIRGQDIVWQCCTQSVLTMRSFSDDFLEDYIKTEGDEILWCVGCYQLEGRGIQLFERICGDYFSVLGLPLQELMQPLRQLGVLAT